MLILSLTTYGKRINTVEQAILSLKSQHYQADRIILWLDQEEFSHADLPSTLTALEDNIFGIQFCPNFRSYKKLVPCIQLYPDATIVTFDDDIIYSPNIVGDLYAMHLAYPTSVISGRARIIDLNHDRTIAPYKNWELVNMDNTAIRAPYCLLPLGYGGVLYPSGSLSGFVADNSLFMAHAPSADDIWFKCMTLLHKRATVVLPFACTRFFKDIEDTQKDSLSRMVNIDNLNGEQLAKVMEVFDELKGIFASTDFGKIEVEAKMLTELLKNNKIGRAARKQNNLFRDAAIKLESQDLQKSFQLMSLAKVLMPKGPLIKKKLKLYQQQLESSNKPE